MQLSVIALGKKRVPIVTKKSEKGMHYSEIFDAFHSKNSEFISNVMKAQVIEDKGFMKMMKSSMKFVAEANRNFPEYVISIILFGSWARGAANPDSDYDLAIVVDDTDLREMTRVEAKQKLFGIINTVAMKISKSFTVQTYLLTEFWEHVKDANPVIFTLLRDGVPLFDKGLFTPWKLLLKMGKIKPTPEAIESFMQSSRIIDKKIESSLEDIVAEKLYYIMINSAQATLMLLGHEPAGYYEVPVLMRRYLVKSNLIDRKYADWVSEIIELRKKVEHGKYKITAKELDIFWKRSKSFLLEMERVFERVKKENISRTISDVEITMEKTINSTLKSLGHPSPKNSYEAFKKHISGLLPPETSQNIQYIQSIKEQHRSGKIITAEELKNAKSLSMDIVNAMNSLVEIRKVDASKSIKFKHGDAEGELWLFSKRAFVMPELKNPSEVFEFSLKGDGSLKPIGKSSIGQLNLLKKSKKEPTYLKKKTIEDLNRFMKSDVEVVI